MWTFSESSWKQQEATSQCLVPSRDQGYVKNFVTTNKLCERKCCCSSWQNSKSWVVFHPDFLS